MISMLEPIRSPSEGPLGDSKSRDYALKLSRFNEFAQPELSGLIRSMGLMPGARVLDMGCGTGETLNLLANEVGSTGTVFGVDLATAHIAVAERRAQPPIQLLRADFYDALFAAGSFDFIWCTNTINHLQDPVRGVAHLRNLLRAGGRLAVGQSSMLPDMYFAWDARLERAVNEAVRRYYWHRYNLGEQDLNAVRGLVGILRDGQFSNISAHTVCMDRTSPLDAAAHAYLGETIFRNTWGERLQPYLAAADYEALAALCDASSPAYALRRHDFHFLQTFTLATGQA